MEIMAKLFVFDYASISYSQNNVVFCVWNKTEYVD